MSEPSQSPPHTGGASAALPAETDWSPALVATLFDPESWRESLDAYAQTTHLAVALTDVDGRLQGPCYNPQPTWRQLHAALGTGGEGCPFALVAPRSCTCVRDALARRTLVLKHERTGIVHFAVPLVLDDHPVGALLAGQIFDQYPEQRVLEHVATHAGLSPQAVWQVARLELPVKAATVRVYGRLLAALGQAFLHTRYHALLDAQRFAALEQRFQERTTALYHEMAERQRLEHEAQRAAHFALLGRLAAGVSHEIRNPLSAVFLHVDLLAEELQQPTAESRVVMEEALTEIRTQLARLEELVQNYLSLVRTGAIQPQPEDLGGAVQAWATEFDTLAALKGVCLHLEGIAELGIVPFHAATLRRALLNLVQNALEAMPQGGTLTLRGQRTPTHVALQIRDTGSGIPSAQRAHIFEPLYTTKPGGTGLGLYIVQEILAAHGGQVTVESVEGQGTTFTLLLPRAVGEAGLVPA
jgi:signal transduction histidine kinase